MLGKIESIIPRQTQDGRDYWEVVINEEIYSCWSPRIKELKGQEVPEGSTVEDKGRYKILRLPKIEGKGSWQPRGRSPEEIIMTAKTMIMSYSKDLCIQGIASGLIKNMVDAQKWTLDTFDILFSSIIPAPEEKTTREPL